MGFNQLGGRQEARTGKDRRIHIEEIESGFWRRQVQAAVEVVPNGADVLPGSLEHISTNPMRLQAGRDDVFSEIPMRLAENVEQRLSVKDIDPHRSQEQILIRFNVQPGI